MDRGERVASCVAPIKDQLQDWARQRAIRFDRNGYTESLEDNLFVALSDETVAEFVSGDGGELGEHGKRGKMQALHSSSALACNVFEYWRGRDAVALSGALGVAAGIGSIGFERKFPTGLQGYAPNLDVVLGCVYGISAAGCFSSTVRTILREALLY